MSGERTFAALLRGINVGGRNKLPMAELRSLFAALGHTGVVTYIQSGNVVFRGSGGDPRATAGGIERRIAETFGLAVAVLLRTRGELETIAAGNPFLAGQPDRSKLHVVFLRDEPAPEAVARLDPARSPGDELTVAGREVYLHLQASAARTKLTLDWIERTLEVDATARNWNTLLRLLDLTGS